MKFTLAWLKDHLETTASVEELSRTLTALGLEVESITDHSAVLKEFIVAEIKETLPHPNASKLQVCTVWDGQTERQIVCGAANARAGLKTVLAREGVYIPGGGITIKKTKIRDIESNGMLCSAEELNLADSSEGILELDARAPVGSSATAALGIDDPIFDIAITPNRADALGVYGIARDLAATGIGTLKPLPALPTIEDAFASPIQVEIHTPDCKHFIGYYIKGVKNTESPAWLQQRLRAVGSRPISALVDITNYFTLTYARPLHVYDASKLSGNIHVRASVAEEIIRALDNQQYILPQGIPVIANDTRALGIAGIIGGVETGCTLETTDVFLEAAWFEPDAIAKAGRSLQIISDARFRFERGVDAGFTEHGAALAVNMILELCGGAASAPAIVGTHADKQRSIILPADAVYALTGAEVSADESARILTALGCTVKQSAHELIVMPPSFRRDMEGKADCVEEIVRIKGYDHIPSTPLPKTTGISNPALNPAQKRLHVVRRLLASRGMHEIYSWSFVARAHAELFGGTDKALHLQNPISADLAVMRPSLLPNLLDATRSNSFRGASAIALCEVGPIFENTTQSGQKIIAGGVRAGNISESHYAGDNFNGKSRAVDCFDTKADAIALLHMLGLDEEKITITRNTPPWYHPGRSGALTLGGKVVLGYFGELHPDVLQRFELLTQTRAVPVSAFELLLDAIPQPRAKGTAKPAFTASEFQPVMRDFAFMIPTNITAEALKRAVRAAEKTLIQDVALFDVYAGKGIPEGHKSVAISVTLQSYKETLTETQLQAVSAAIVQAAATLGATLRG